MVFLAAFSIQTKVLRFRKLKVAAGNRLNIYSTGSFHLCIVLIHLNRSSDSDLRLPLYKTFTMLFRLIFFVLAVLSISSCRQSGVSHQKTESVSTDTVANASFNRMLESYYQDNLKLYPLQATA